jgi:ABC-type sugar transport system ATPase subunit
VLDRLARLGRVDARREMELVQQYVTDLDIQTPSMRQAMGNLSGGNQQKVILSRWLSAQSAVLILDEPTRGIDVGSKAEIHLLVARLAQQGKGIVYISSELPEVLGISDRIVVFHEGRVVGEFDGRTATEQMIMQAIMQAETRPA